MSTFDIGLSSLITTIQSAIKIYTKIIGQEDPITDVEDRLSEVTSWLIPINNHLVGKYGPSVYYPETATLQILTNKMLDAATSIHQIFQHFYIAARTDDNFAYIRTTRFAASNSSRALSTLLTTLERHTATLDHHITTMNHKYLTNTHKQQISKIPSYKSHTLPGTSTQRPTRILFIDDKNTNRSLLAQGYAQLLRDWTHRSHLPWHITTIHSAGLHVRDTTPTGLSILQDRLSLPLAPTGSPPSPLALSSLLSHATSFPPFATSPALPSLSKHLTFQPSRGLSNTTFNAYDYIFVFSFKDNVSLQKLKAMVRKTYGGYAAPRSKARVVMLGEYASGSKGSSEIFAVGKEVVGEEKRRREWERVMGVIRVGFRGWLREELGWERPGH